MHIEGISKIHEMLNTIHFIGFFFEHSLYANRHSRTTLGDGIKQLIRLC